MDETTESPFATPKRPGSKQGVAILIGVIVAGLFLCCGGATLWNATHPPEEHKPSGRDIERQLINTASADVQRGRKDVIDKFVASGTIHKVEFTGRFVRLYVMQPFHQLPFDHKTKVVALCHIWGYGLPNKSGKEFGEPTLIYDALTDKKIGRFTLSWGLSLD